MMRTVKWKQVACFAVTSAAVFLCGICGCMNAGEEQMVPVTTPATGGSENTDSLADGDAETDSSGNTDDEAYKTIVLTDEEAEQDHLTGQILKNVSIDAYITPRSYYADGIGQWTAEYRGDSEGWHSYGEIGGETCVLDRVSFSELVSRIDQMAESLGSVWQEGLASAIEKNSRTYFGSCGVSTIYIYTPGTWVHGGTNDSGYYLGCGMDNYGVTSEAYSCFDASNGFLYHGNTGEELDFLDTDTLLSAVLELVDNLYPTAGKHYDFYTCSEEWLREAGFDVSKDEKEEWYTLVFYETIEGLPVKRAYVRNEIPAGKMAEDYYTGNEDGSYGDLGGTDCELMTLNVTKDGFELYLYSGLEATQYAEAREVVDINEILEKCTERLRAKSGTIVVSDIELVMNDVVAQDEDGMYRIVYSPIWIVEYYKFGSGSQVGERYQMTFDGYTGDFNYELILY